MSFNKPRALGVLIFSAMCLTGCVDTDPDILTQNNLDDMFREYLDPNIVQSVPPGSNEIKPVCRYLDDNDGAAAKVYSSFSFIEQTHYILYICEHEKYSKIYANPKYLKSHVEKVGDDWIPKNNPLNLRSYVVEFYGNNDEMISLRTLVE